MASLLKSGVDGDDYLLWRKWTMSSCPRNIHLRRFLAGGLAPDDRTEMEEHLTGCAVCRSFLENITGYAETISSKDVFPHEGNQTSDPSLPHIPGFDIQSLIAHGGHGVIYRAVNTTTKRTVALKLLRAGVTASRQERMRFQKNGEALARLSHPNIVTLYSVGEYQGHPYVEMEYVEGGSLDRLIRHSFPTERETATLLKQLAQAVQYAHEHGVIHRDLKPGNVLLHRTDLNSNALSYSSFSPKIADFGLAKMIPDDGMLTPTFSILGTPSYMAPEVASGEAQAATIAADIYGLGAIGYDLLTGRPPFFGATPYDTIRMVIQDEPTLPIRLRANLSRDVETVLLKCLEKDPQRRYPTAKALAEEWDRILLGKPVVARPISVITRLGRTACRYPVVSGLLAALAFVIVSSVIGLTILWRQAVAAQELARKNEERADRRLQYAQSALEAFKVSAQKRASERHRRGQEDCDGLRKLAKLYELICEESPDNPDVRHDSAYAMLQISDMIAELGDMHDASALTQKGLEHIRAVVAACPQNAKYRSSLSEACTQTVGHRQAIGIFDGNRPLIEEAFQLAESLVREYPDKDHYRGTRAMFALTLGNELLREGRHEDARNLFRDAVTTHAGLLEKYGKEDPHRHVYYSIALGFLATGEFHCGAPADEYLAILKEQLNKMESYHQTNPEAAAAHLSNVLGVQISIADVYLNTGRIDLAMQMEAQAERFSRACLEKFPDSRVYQLNRAGQLMRIAFRTAAVDRFSAIALMNEAFRIYRQSPDGPYHNRALANMWLYTLPELRNPQAAAEWWKEHREFANSSPIDRVDLAIALHQLRRYDEAEAEFTKSESSPGIDYKIDHVRWFFRIMNRFRMGQVDVARREFRERSALMRSDYRTTCEAWTFHDEAWRLIEGTEPPSSRTNQPTQK
jgi:serine/threonine protein kinase